MTITRTSLDQALARSSDRPADLESALADVNGYMRFLRVAGAHAHQLAQIADHPTPCVPRLTRRLLQIPRASAAVEGDWASVVASLGAAHDLIATHLGPAHELRTAEAPKHLTGTSVTAASAAVIQLVSDSAVTGRATIEHAADAQRHLKLRPLGTADLHRLRSTNQSVTLYASAALWDLRVIPRTDSPMDELRPARMIEAAPTVRVATNPLDDLRDLCELVAAQAAGRLPASPASLRDLALLGARSTHPARMHLRTPTDSLSAIRAAQQQDQLVAAHNAWRCASIDLTHRIRGLTKAPATFSQSITRLLAFDDLNPQERDAVTSVLPQLARAACHVVARMVGNGDLLTGRRAPGQLRVTWDSITPGDGAELRARFERAADESARYLTILGIERVPCGQAFLPAERMRGPAQHHVHGRGATR